MKQVSKYLLLSSLSLFMAACSFVNDEGNDSHDSQDYTVPYLA